MISSAADAEENWTNTGLFFFLEKLMFLSTRATEKAANLIVIKASEEEGLWKR